MAWNKELGSIWRRWDLHIHTLDTIKNNEFDGDWEKYISKVEAAPKEISVIGFTDYFRIEGYKSLAAGKRAGRMANIDMILPNIEFRLQITVGSSNRLINIHLLINPEDPEHTSKIEEALSHLTIVNDKQPYACDDRGFISLGKAVYAREHKLGQFDDRTFLLEGISKFCPSLDTFRTWYEGQAWLRKNSIVVVSNSSDDGVSGIPPESDRSEIRNEILRLSDAIFSGKPSDRNYYLGQGADKPEVLARKIGGLKPCIHGSDAHNFDRMFEPNEQRYCWIKADPTFEGLKQILFEPEERVFIGTQPQNQRYPDKVIKSLKLTKTPAWYQANKIELNPGYISIIGNKGSGKTALADMISYATQSWNDDKSSFIRKAAKEFSGVEIEIEWADGHKSIKTINPKEYAAKDVQVRYLSQQFVEKLCSEDRLGESLRTEIEKVVFTHIDETLRLGASDFAELRKKKTSSSITNRLDTGKSLHSNLEEYISLNAEIFSRAEKNDRKARLEADIKAIQKDMPKEDQAEQDLTKKITAIREKETEIIQKISDFRVSVEKFQKTKDKVDKFSINLEAAIGSLKSELSDCGVSAEAIETLPVFKKEQIGDELTGKINKIEGDIAALIGPKIEPSPEGGVAQESNELDLEKATLNQIKHQIQLLELKETQDNEKRQRINKSLKDIQELQKKIKTIEDEIKRIDTVSIKKRDELFKLVSDNYKELFTSLEAEEKQLENLYEPLKDRLSGGASHEKRLTFYIQRDVDHKAWCERGYSMFDARKIKQTDLGTLEEFTQKVEERLLEAWKSNDTATTSSEIEKFLRAVEKNGPIENLLKGSYSPKDIYLWLFSVDHITMTYGMKYDGISLEKLSPGTKGVILLMLYLEMDKSDNRPLIVDQPEENLDNQSVYGILTTYFREAKKHRQIIVITHNPNLVVNTDADQIIVAQSKEDESLEVRPITYKSGAIENTFSAGHASHPGIRELCCDILEGGTEAFSMRDKRYASKH